MKNQKLALSMTVILGMWAFWAVNASATTWYVRDGGGNATQCTGTTNAVYPGSGSGQACAYSHPAWVLGGGASPSTNNMAPGDTLYIDGDSDIAPGTQAKYLIGLGMPNAGGCNTSNSYSCLLNGLPAGTGTGSGNTSMIGTGTHKPLLYPYPGTWQIIGSTNNDVTYQWLELQGQGNCAYNDPVNGCTSNSIHPDGMYLGGDDVNLTDVYVHGFGRYGINGQAFGSATFTRVWVIGNGYGGIIIGNGGNQSVTGTLTFNQPIIEWNGCVEKYPLTNPGIDNPSNYMDCFGQQSGGYGDGLAFGAITGEAPGNWTLIGPGSVSFNTQDGWDILHGNLSGTDSADKMRFEGNGGQQIKVTGLNDNITNSVIIGDCGWWQGAAQSLPGGMQYGDSCRAEGDVVLMAVTNNSVANFYNNTIIANGIAINYKDTGSTGCNASTKLNLYNNIALGGPRWLDDSTINPANNGGNASAAWTYASGNDGNGSGTCGSLLPTEDYNVVDNFNNNDYFCAGAHDKCGTNPGFVSAIPNGTLNGNESTFYNAWSGATYVPIASSGAASGAGLSGLPYWNTGNDFHNMPRTNPPSIGAEEISSCAAASYGCQFNSDCCTGSCTNNACGSGSSSPQPLVAITNPLNGSNVSVGSDVTINANASEPNGTITNIAIYNGSTLLGSSSASAYSYTMSNPAAGKYAFTAVATDAKGVSMTSNPSMVTVAAQSILPSLPVVAVSSPGGNTFTAGSNVTITTAASETNGTISNISLYDLSGILLGSSSTSPYNFIYTNMLAGTYTFHAVATDITGTSTTSSPITVTVTPATVPQSLPVVAITGPGNGSSFTAGSNVLITTAASETNGTIAHVAFYYNGTNLLGTITSSPFNLTATNVQPGSYTVSAVATDANGISVTSNPISVTVTSGNPVVPSLPVVTLTNPASGSSFTAGSNITMTASASETNGTISKVAFYNGSILLGTANSSPYSVTWTNVAAGSYNLTAVVTDAISVSATSSPVTVKVTAPVVPPSPVVAITSPGSGSSFLAGSNILIATSASETNGTIAHVAFYYNGTNLLGTVTSSPFNLTATNVQPGNYTVTAVATDANGVSTTSSPITVTVTAVPSVPVVTITSPVSGINITANSTVTITAAASQTNGAISKVAFYNGSTLLGTSTSSPYSFTWSNIATNIYIITAVATGSNGVSATSSPVTIIVAALPLPSLPVVAITSPANGSSFANGSNITITATASEKNGVISRVVFYNGSTLLGTSLASPYSYTLKKAAAGSYRLTAEAYDLLGNATTSTAVVITVSASKK